MAFFRVRKAVALPILSRVWISSKSAGDKIASGTSSKTLKAHLV